MVSVCLASYNGEKYIKEQVQSILGQLSFNDELIVSDDGSLDNTLRIIEEFNDQRVKIYYNQDKKGVVGNFENALKRAKGDYIFLSDQDDVWLPDKVQKCLQVLNHADLVVTDCLLTNSDLNIVHPSFFKLYKSRSGFFKNLWRNTYVGACVAFKKELLNIVLPIPGNLPVYHEGWIASLADLKGKVIFLNEPLMLFRRHESNASFTACKSGLSIYQKIMYRIKLLYLVIKRLLSL